MLIVSTWAIEQVVQDIRDGVTYPDFWTNRYGEEDDKQTEQESKEEKKEEVAQA